MSNVDQFFSACVYARERVNPHMFVYAASVALLHRNDTRHIQIPPNCEVLPELYVDGSIFARAKEEVGVIPSGSRVRYTLANYILPARYCMYSTYSSVVHQHSVCGGVGELHFVKKFKIKTFI